MEEEAVHHRDETVVDTVGKGCALGVLFLSLSDQMSRIIGISYFNASSFLVCLFAALAFSVLIARFRSPHAHLAFACVTSALCVAWVTLTFVLQVAPTTSLVGLAFASVGRFSTLVINMQWNYRISLGTPERVSGSAAASVLLGVALFFACASIPGLFAQLLAMAMVVACCVMNLVVCLAEIARSPLVQSAELVARQDVTAHVASESRAQTRMLYFGSRALYGVVLGLLVSLSSLGATGSIDPSAGVAAAALALTLAAFGLSTAQDGRSSARLTCMVPVVVGCIAWLGFVPTGEGSLPFLSALLAEAFWTTQNLCQLPSYRRMTGVDASVFAYADYAAQIAPFYLIVWALSSSGALGRYLELRGADVQALSLALVVTLGVACTLAMVRHMLRYLPSTAGRDEAGAPLPASVASDAVPSTATDAGTAAAREALHALSQRELDVFALMSQGYSRSYIAKVLYVTPETVKTHARHIYAKLGISSKDELIAIARSGRVADARPDPTVAGKAGASDRG